jgi:TonB-like protein
MHKLGRRETLRNIPNVDPDPAPDTIRASFRGPPGEQGPTRPRHSFRWHWYALSAVLIVALGGLSYGIYLTWRLQTPTSTGLGLRAERHGKEFRISWNREVPVINHARGAVLSIRDGDSQPHELQLDPEQLLNGSVVYGAANNSVQVRLEVMGHDGTKTSETILAGVVPVAHVKARPGVASQPTAGSSSRNRRLSPSRPAIVDPPSPSASVPPQTFALIEQLAFAQPRLPVPAGSQQNGMIPSFVAARAIHESLPDLSSAIRATVVSEVEVQVKVQIDEYGRAVRVGLVGSTGPANDALVSATREAARLWRFAPAVRESQPVASEVVLMFRYIPKTDGN